MNLLNTIQYQNQQMQAVVIDIATQLEVIEMTADNEQSKLAKALLSHYETVYQHLAKADVLMTDDTGGVL